MHGSLCAGLVSSLLLTGCIASPSYKEFLPYDEPVWARDGQVIIFEEVLWTPRDVVEHLLDREVEEVGVHDGAPLYIDKRDVRPFARLYIKVDALTFRVLERSE